MAGRSFISSKEGNTGNRLNSVNHGTPTNGGTPGSKPNSNNPAKNGTSTK